VISDSPAAATAGGTTPTQRTASPRAVLGARKLDARKLKTKNRISVRLDFTLARAARLFLIVRGPAPSCQAVGFIPIKGSKGHNTVVFAGRVQGHRLKPGVYLISLSTTRQFSPGAPTEYVRVVSPRRSLPLPDSTLKPSCFEAGTAKTYSTTWISLVESMPSPPTRASRPAAERPTAQVAGAQSGDDDEQEAAGVIPGVGGFGAATDEAAEHPFFAVAVLVLVGALLLTMVALVTRFLRGSWNP